MKINILHSLWILGIILISGCNNEGSKVANLSPDAHQVKAEEVIQTSKYTYVRVSFDGGEYWAAINKADIKEGETYYWSVGMEMNDFTSKELNRTFKSIYFIQDFSDVPITATMKPMPGADAGMPGHQTVPEHNGIKIEKAENGFTIEELYSSPEKYSGKKVRVRGSVVKFSPGIMKRNWVHIQDGTSSNGRYDLTITTSDSVKMGDVATFEGVFSVNKDFGAGYVYEVIVEDGKVLKK